MRRNVWTVRLSLCVLWYATLFAPTSHAQVLEVGPDLGLQLGSAARIDLASPQADGTLIVGGSFIRVRGGPARGIAVLDSQGALASSLPADCRGIVGTFGREPCRMTRAVRAEDGSLIVAGVFSSIGGVQRAGLAKILPGGTGVDPNWNPLSWVGPASVLAMATQGNRVYLAVSGGGGRVIAVSLYGTGQPVVEFAPVAFNGQILFSPEHVYFVQGPANEQRVRRARLGDGALDPGWQSRYFDRVEGMAFDAASNSIFVAGAEPFGGSIAGRYLLRVDAGQGAAESPAWANYHGDVRPFRSLHVSANAIFADACSPQSGSCQVQRYALNANGARDPGYNGDVLFGYTTVLGVDAQGRALLSLSSYPSPGPDQSQLLRLTSSGVIDDGFRPAARGSAAISGFSTSSSGDIVMFGNITWAGATPHGGLVRLRASDDRIAPWTAFILGGGGFSGYYPTTFAADASNNVFLASTFFSDDGTTLPPRLQRLASESQPVLDWNPGGSVGDYNGFDAGIDVLLVDDLAGWLYIGGRFEGPVCGQPRRNLARVSLGSPCAADPSWRPDPNAEVLALTQDGQGRVIVGGAFTEIDGQPIQALARFDGAVIDSAWRPLAPGLGRITVRGLVATPEHVFAKAGQAIPGSNEAIGLLRFRSDGAPLEPAWQPPPADTVDVMLATSDGRLLAARRGVQTSEFGTRADRLELYAPGGNGTPLATLNVTDQQRINALASRVDGSVLVGGLFDRLGGQARDDLAVVYLTPTHIFDNGFE